MVSGKVDTGAMATCMPLSMFLNMGLKKSQLQPTKSRLKGVTGTDMKTCGELAVKVTCNGHTDNVKVIVTELGTELILGLTFCKEFKLISIRSRTRQNFELVHIIGPVQNFGPPAQNFGPLRAEFAWRE